MSNRSVSIFDKEYWLHPDYVYPENEDGLVFAEPTDLFGLPLFAVAILIIRIIFERIAAKALISKFGIKDAVRKKPEENEDLESLHRMNKYPTDNVVKAYARKLQCSEMYVQGWLRRRRNLDRPPLSAKFAEAFWRGSFYTFAFAFGMVTLWHTPWFWDNEKCWSGYPEPMRPSIYYYYMIEGGFYISLLFSILKDVKRNDFKEQLIHHITTNVLIILSYITHMSPVGSLVLAIHDVSDIFLEYGKCFNYAKRSNISDRFFTTFAVVFIVSRLVVFPCVVLYTTLVRARPYNKQGSSHYYYFNALLLVLQMLHVFWAWIIVKMAIKMVSDGKVTKDDRSDVEELTADENGGDKIKKEM